MANEPLVLARELQPEALDDNDYHALHAALVDSGRGRAFLAEYARRNRHADTELLLAAIGRLETRLAADASAVDRLRSDLRMLLIAIRHVRPEINAASPAAQAVKLAALLDLMERRLDAMAGNESVAAEAGDHAADSATVRLAVVPHRDEPELPIPSPMTADAPAISLVADAATLPVADEGGVGTRPAIAAAVEPVAHAGSPLPEPPADPLAAIMALSEDERLALFT